MNRGFRDILKNYLPIHGLIDIIIAYTNKSWYEYLSSPRVPAVMSNLELYIGGTPITEHSSDWMDSGDWMDNFNGKVTRKDKFYRKSDQFYQNPKLINNSNRKIKSNKRK